jgi:hypothetical protein
MHLCNIGRRSREDPYPILPPHSDIKCILIEQRKHSSRTTVRTVHFELSSMNDRSNIVHSPLLLFISNLSRKIRWQTNSQRRSLTGNKLCKLTKSKKNCFLQANKIRQGTSFVSVYTYFYCKY